MAFRAQLIFEVAMLCLFASFCRGKKVQLELVKQNFIGGEDDRVAGMTSNDVSVLLQIDQN